MSEGKPPVPEELHVLAGEYVLGALDQAEMRAVRKRALADPDFAAVIADWERKLAPMAEAVPPVPPPEALWSRIEHAIAPMPSEPGDEALPWPPAPPATQVHPIAPLVARPRATSGTVAARKVRVWPWKLATVASLAMAAGFAAIAVMPTLAPQLGIPAGVLAPAPMRVAALTPPDAHMPGFFATARPDGTIVLRAMTNVPVPSGHDLQLWILPPGATVPTSLGVLASTGGRVTLPHMPGNGTQLMVSMEPQGGSPTGAPTGPVLYAGSIGGTLL